MKTKNKITTALLTSGLLLPAMAQARWFEVEVILFARNQDPALVAEKFPEKVEPLSERRRLDILELIYKPQRECIQIGDNQSSLPMTQDLLTTQVSQPCIDPAVGGPKVNAVQQSGESVESVNGTDGASTQADLLAEQPTNEFTGENALKAIVRKSVLAEFSPVSSVKPELDENAYLLTAEMLQFGEILQKLEQHGAYRPMLHTGWRMDFNSKRKMPILHLVAGQNFGDRFDIFGELLPVEETAEQAFVETTESLSLTSPTPQPELIQQPVQTDTKGSVSLLTQTSTEPVESPSMEIDIAQEASLAESLETEPQHLPVWEMEVNLKLWLETWLHVSPQIQLRIQSERDAPIEEETQTADLGLNESVITDEQDAVIHTTGSLLTGESTNPHGSLVKKSITVPYLHSYQMDQFRRVRSEEIHYFDHPLMGMIIQIRKFEPVTLESLDKQK